MFNRALVKGGLFEINLDQYKLMSYFSRKNQNHGGSCIYAIYIYIKERKKERKKFCTKDLNCSQNICVEKDFEVSITELVDYRYIIVCVYRSPDGNFWIFLKKLELIIQKIQSRNKKPILCGNWNLNFMVNNKRLQELQNLLESYNMMKTVSLE